MTLHAKIDDPIRSIGVEFEVTMPLIGGGSTVDVQRMVAGVLSANGLRASYRTYSHAPVPANCDCMVEIDSSVTGETRYAGITWMSLEIKTRILNGYADYMAVVPKMLDIVRYCGGRTNRSCGAHVHIGFPEARTDPTTIRSLYNLIHRVEPVLFALQPPSRSNNNYCRPLPDVSRALHGCRTLDCFARSLAHLDRYQGLNWTHLFDGDGAPRIEYRYGAGTLDPVKASHMLRLFLRLTDHATLRCCQASPKQIEGTKAGLHKLETLIGLRINSKIYSTIDKPLRETGRYLLIKRWKELHPDASKSTGQINAAHTQEA